MKATKQAFFTYNYITTWYVLFHKYFDLQSIKLYKRFLITCCHLLQNLTEIMPTEEVALKQLSKLLKSNMTGFAINPSLFKDLLNAVGEDLFGLCVEAKVKGNQFGNEYLCRLLMTFETNYPPQRHKDKFQ